MSTELVERLRGVPKSKVVGHMPRSGVPVVEIDLAALALERAEAADELTALTAKVALLELERSDWEAACDGNTALGAEIAEGYRQRLGEAEQRIAALMSERANLIATKAEQLAALTKRATAAEAKVELLTEALKQHEKLLCINAVRDAARQTAPLWLEAADAAASRALSEPDKEGML